MEQRTATGRGIIILCSVLGIIIGGITAYFSLRSQRPSAPIVVSTPAPTATPPPSPTPSPIRVYVSGAVRNPTVCEIAFGSMIQDAVAAAGGPTTDADLDGINLALELQDQQHIHVPRVGDADPPPVVSGGASRSGEATGLLVDINTATAGQLETLPGVGPVIAKRIIDYREANGPFQAIDEIQNVSGIGSKTYEGLEDMITVGP